ncbi:MAG: DNA-3-methyladenine glycosylase I [Paracoccaceae bacterium]
MPSAQPSAPGSPGSRSTASRAFDADDVARLLADKGIVRHRGKIEATITNARRAQDLITSEGSLARYFWRFEPADPATAETVAKALSRDLAKRGWKFTGPTTMLSFLQAAGLYNAHPQECAAHASSERARAGFVRPR